MQSIHLLADKFMHAFYEREWKGELAPPVAELSISEAYEVQTRVAHMRQQRGEEIAGYKVGCTSAAIQSQFGLSEPISAPLFSPYTHTQGACFDLNSFANCAIEPEMVLVIGKDLQGLELTDEQLIDAIEYVSPGIELHHYRFWSGSPSLQELICSGGIHAGLVIGDSQVSAKQMSFKNEIFSVYKDGQLITAAPASEIMGGPLHSLRWLVNFLTQKGVALKKGSLVIPGSPVELVPIIENTKLSIEIEGVGSALAQFVSRGKNTNNK